MADYQGKQIKEIGVMSSLPYILQTGTILLATALADMLQVLLALHALIYIEHALFNLFSVQEPM